MNDLARASSPYLLQHANNPVDWKEWSPEILKTAQIENKLLLISIGYAACHWCHVMEKECFKNDEVAAVMNRYFIPIKVDREERPDIDKVYMDAAQLINRQAGWPLNAFALPDGRPFFAGTYFPKSNWLEILEKIAQVYAETPDKIQATADQVSEGLDNINIDRFKAENSKTSNFTYNRYREIGENWSNYVDFRFGGFKRAPKFPFPAFWSFLLQYHYFTDDKDALQATKNTLDQMIEGGIYDHLGGGFARYAVDEYWKVPHFEKMLYDNAQLISLMAHAYKLTRQKNYQMAIQATIQFIDKELKAEHQGYYSSLNADSEGEEGRFYIWQKSELEQTLSNDEFTVCELYYQISKNGNWEDGKHILHAHKKLEEVAKTLEITMYKAEDLLWRAQEKLKKERNNRIKPSWDDKQLTAWNALLVSGFVDAFQALNNENYRQKAIDLADFLIINLVDDNNLLYRNFRNDKASISGFLDDYAFLIQALIKVYQITFEINYLNKAKTLADQSIDMFLDQKVGLFTYQNHRSDRLVSTSYEVDDNVIPSSNAVMAENLTDLSAYFDKQHYATIVDKMMQALQSEFEHFSPNISQWLQVMGKLSHNAIDIAITGDNSQSLADELQKHYLPLVRYCGGNEENLALLKGKVKSDKSLIYVCKNKTCLAPTDSIDEALNQIKN